MSTRSAIAWYDPTFKTAMSVYCHWDGYPEGVGRTLLDYYNDESRVKSLVSLGDLSYVGKFLSAEEYTNSYSVTSEARPHSFDNPWPHVTVAYGRDRGENNVDTHVWNHVDSVSDLLSHMEKHYDWSEFLYVYDVLSGKWVVRYAGDNNCVPLEEAVQENELDEE